MIVWLILFKLLVIFGDIEVWIHAGVHERSTFRIAVEQIVIINFALFVWFALDIVRQK